MCADGAGASHDLIKRLDKLAARRGYELTYSVGWSLGSDASTLRTDTAPQAMAIIRNTLIAAFRLTGWHNLKQTRDDEPADELRRMLDAARRVDHSVITLLYEQLTAIRRLDRQLGAIIVRDELTAKIAQVDRLMSHSLTPRYSGAARRAALRNAHPRRMASTRHRSHQAIMVTPRAAKPKPPHRASSGPGSPPPTAKPSPLTATEPTALTRLDPSFVRAETSLRVDLATALTATGEHDEARIHANRARTLAAQLGSARQT